MISLIKCVMLVLAVIIGSAVATPTPWPSNCTETCTWDGDCQGMGTPGWCICCINTLCVASKNGHCETPAPPPPTPVPPPPTPAPPTLPPTQCYKQRCEKDRDCTTSSCPHCDPAFSLCVQAPKKPPHVKMPIGGCPHRRCSHDSDCLVRGEQNSCTQCSEKGVCRPPKVSVLTRGVPARSCLLDGCGSCGTDCSTSDECNGACSICFLDGDYHQTCRSPVPPKNLTCSINLSDCLDDGQGWCTNDEYTSPCHDTQLLADHSTCNNNCAAPDNCDDAEGCGWCKSWGAQCTKSPWLSCEKRCGQDTECDGLCKHCVKGKCRKANENMCGLHCTNDTFCATFSLLPACFQCHPTHHHCYNPNDLCGLPCTSSNECSSSGGCSACVNNVCVSSQETCGINGIQTTCTSPYAQPDDQCWGACSRCFKGQCKPPAFCGGACLKDADCPDPVCWHCGLYNGGEGGLCDTGP